ncbi:MAG: hypothetical protein AAGG02_09160 [Cyanobacteria bacterium P01_H01_bin.15]
MTGVVVTPKFCIPFSALWSAYRQGHAQGNRLLAAAGIPTEPSIIAITVEQYRWAWRPQKVRILLLGESHIYTSAHDFKLQLNPHKLPPFPPSAPTSFVRIIYCLGYGEPELLSGKPKRRNTGTRQFWDLFGRLAATGQAPRKKRDSGALRSHQLENRDIAAAAGTRNLGVRCISACDVFPRRISNFIRSKICAASNMVGELWG